MSTVLFGLTVALGVLALLFVAGLVLRIYQFQKHVKPEVPDCTFIEFLNMCGRHPTMKVWFIVTMLKVNKTIDRGLSDIIPNVTNIAKEAMSSAYKKD